MRFVEDGGRTWLETDDGCRFPYPVEEPRGERIRFVAGKCGRPRRALDLEWFPLTMMWPLSRWTRLRRFVLHLLRDLWRAFWGRPFPWRSW